MESAVISKLEIQRLYIKECSYEIPHAPAGFPALLLVPMNFEQLYQQQHSSEVPAKDTPLN